MAEKLSVISLSYQMVEGLINNFKSNNWRAGQTRTHTHTHNISCLYRSPAQAQMHIIHTCLLIHTARKSNSTAAIVLSMCLCTVPLSSSWRLPPRQLPRLSAEAIVGVEGRCCGWAPGSQTVSHTLLIGSYWPLGDNKNTPSSLHLSPLPGFTGNRSHLFQHNDIILIGAATVGLHLLALGIVIRQRWVMLIRAAKGKEPLTQPGGQRASAVSGSPLQT